MIIITFFYYLQVAKYPSTLKVKANLSNEKG